MTIAALLVPDLYTGYIINGLELTLAEIRHVTNHPVGGALRANLTDVEYMVWPARALGLNSAAPTYYGSTGTTNAAGEFVLDVTGTFFPSDEVYVALHKSQGAAGGDDDDFGFGADTVTAS